MIKQNQFQSRVAATEPLGDGRQDMVFVVRRHSLT